MESQQHQVANWKEKKWSFSTPSSGPSATVVEVGVLGPVGTTPEAVVPGRSSPVAVFVVVVAEPCGDQRTHELGSEWQVAIVEKWRAKALIRPGRLPNRDGP